MLPLSARDGQVQFQLLGGVRMLDGAGREVPVGPAKRQLVLAALLLDAGRLVTVDALVDRGWGQDPPPQVAGVLRAHLSRIRTLLTATGSGSGPALVRRAGGYVLEVDPAQVDVHRFRSVAAAVADAADDEERVALVGRARADWTGDPLAGLSGYWAEETAAALRREYFDLTVVWAGAQLRLGQVGAVVGALGELVERDRFDEVLGAVFLQALAASGRRAQALAEYGRIRERLVAELGSEPGPELRAVYESLLDLDPAAAAPTPVRPAAVRAPAAGLPPAAYPFCGRDADLAALDAARAGSARTVVLTGVGGVGKTALAVQWAWRLRESYADGQLYLDLRGLDAEPVSPARALGHFLRALGVPPADVPADVDERAALYRSCLAGRRVLVVLDNAGSSAQVRPLLPGSPSCLAVVTGRRRLDGLVARDGAAPLDVDVLDPAASVDLVATMLPGSDPAGDSLPRLAELCGGLPLALRIAAARVLADPARSVPALVSDLAGRHRLAGLAVEDGDAAVRGTFDLSYRTLPAAAARAFRLLGPTPATGDGLGPPATAALLGLDDRAAREVVGRLADAHLVVLRPDGRHDLHDLVRLFARERADADGPATSADEGLRRLLRWYVRQCDAMDQVLSPGRLSPRHPDAGPGGPASFPDEAAALAWFRVEAVTLHALFRIAADRRWDDLTWPLATGQAEALRREHRTEDLLAVADAGAAAARRVGNLAVEGTLTNVGGIACALAGRLDDAVGRMQRAAELSLRDGNLSRAGLIRMNVGCARSDQGRYDQARSELRAALDLLERADHAVGVAVCVGNLGELHRRCGDYAEAERYLRRAIDGGTELGSQRDLAVALENLAAVLAAVEQPDQAFDEYDRALAMARSCGDRLTEGRALAGRGDLLASLGRTAQAVPEWRGALAVLERIGAPEAAAVRGRLTSA